MANKKKGKKIVRYRKPLNINVGVIIFALIFVYMTFSVYTYLRRDKIQFYEVVEGGIVNNKEYTGVILRQESTKYTDRAGYVNYYVREGKRASIGTRVYSIDESESIASYLADSPDVNVTLDNENLASLKKQLSSFVLSYSDENFGAVYDAKYSLEASVLEYVNFNTLDNLDAALEKMGVNFVQVRADTAGVVSYVIDSYETLTANDISADVFNKSNWTRKITKSGQLAEKDASVYKLITSDQWSVIFPLSEEDVAAYGDKTSLKVSFTGRDLTASGKYSMITGTDGKPYGKLDFNKYMVQFVSDRFIEFEIITEQVDGLKIPVSSVATKSFFLVPVDYLTQGGDSIEPGFMKEIYTDKGTTVEFVPTTLYYSTDESYYIDMSAEAILKNGDYIVKPGSSDRFQIGTNASLEGVYNINKGYAVFKQIEVLTSNDEYYTVRKNMKYGLSVYDHIVLNSKTITEGQFIY